MKKKSCTCEECIKCCERVPGLFIPGEATKLAKHLKMSLKELYLDWLVIDYYLDGYSEIYCLTPVKRTFTPGQVVSFGYRTNYATCIFLDKDRRCSIHKYKPYECKYTYGCTKDREKPTAFHEIAELWKTAEGKQEIRMVNKNLVMEY